jgi:hypothetical protein
MLFGHTRPFNLHLQGFAATGLEIFEAKGVQTRLESDLAGSQSPGPDRQSNPRTRRRRNAARA